MSAPISISPSITLAPGEIIGGKYRLDGFLGEGGMGVVLSATHLELDSPVAIKILRDDLAQNEDVVSSLLFEARAAARMRGTHIVRVLDVARFESGAPYIVMEQLRGRDLGADLAEGAVFSAKDAVNWLTQACDGLAEAHALGIIHRDLKPANLFLAETPEGVVLKVLDFGISKNVGTSVRSGRRSTLSKLGSAVGSPYYMAPEQMRASPDLDARADIWSLGAILFELLTGSCPFEADTPALLCAKVMAEEAPSLRQLSKAISPELDAVVRRCLQKEASARFQSVTELADALRALDRPPPRSRKKPLTLLGSSALIVLGAACSWYFAGHQLKVPSFSTHAAAAAELTRAWPSLTPSATSSANVPLGGAAVASPVVLPVASALPKPNVTQALRARSAFEQSSPTQSSPVHPEPVPSPTTGRSLVIVVPAVPAALPHVDTLPPSDAPPPSPDRDSVGARYDL